MCTCKKSNCKVCSSTIVRGKTGKTGPRGPKGDTGDTTLIIENTVYVMKNGNDSTGLVERFDKPFLTIAAARTAALAAFTSRTNSERIKIVVESGFYEEDIILDKFIDYDLGNSVIDGEITDNQVDFGTNTGTIFTNIIYGNATIHNTASTGRTHAMQIYKTNSKVLLYANELSSDNDNAVAITGGHVRLFVNKIYSNDITKNYSVPLELTQGAIEEEFGPSLVEIYGSDIYNVAGAKTPAIAFTYGSNTKNQTLVLINCRVANNSTAGASGYNSAIQIGQQIASDANIVLYNTTLYSESGSSIYTHTGNTATIKYYHSNMANTAASGSGTLTVNLGTLTVNTNVSPEF